MKVIKGIVILLLVGLLSAGLLVLYSFKIEPNMVRIKEYELGAETIEPSLKVVQVSDIHMSEDFDVADLENVVEKINKQQPDLILFTGDLYDNYAKFQNVSDIKQALGKLQASYGKYAIWGNRDYGGGASRVYEDVMYESGFEILRNDGINITLQNNKTLYLAGLDDYLMGRPDTTTIQTALGQTDYEILMVHEPDIVQDLADWKIDLFLAGHSHGGQIRIPFINAIQTDLAQVYNKGFYTIDENSGSQLYVNSGIGTTKIAARFNAPPEIAVFQIAIE